MTGSNPARARSRILFVLLALACLLVVLLRAITPAHADTPLLDLTRFRGQVVVLDFWASWCAPCRRSIPWLNEMQAKYRDRGLVVIGVNVDQERGDAERFLVDTPSHFMIVYDAGGQLPKQYGIEAMPSSFIFDRTGKLATKHVGFQNARRDEYEQELRALLGDEQSAAPGTGTDTAETAR